MASTFSNVMVDWTNLLFDLRISEKQQVVFRNHKQKMLLAK